jgi:hypothetical protein
VQGWCAHISRSWSSHPAEGIVQCSPAMLDDTFSVFIAWDNGDKFADNLSSFFSLFLHFVLVLLMKKSLTLMQILNL